MITIYHNPRCRKSREGLAIVQGSGRPVTVIEYLKEPPTAAQLKEILKYLGLSATDIIRKNEKLYKEEFKNKQLTEPQWLKVLVDNPILIERPIVVKGKQARLGRPPEVIKELL